MTMPRAQESGTGLREDCGVLMGVDRGVFCGGRTISGVFNACGANLLEIVNFDGRGIESVF